MAIEEPLLSLLRAPSLCFISTLMPDGSPQLTEVWVDTDGEHVVVNTVEGFQKLRNIRRDARVALAIADRDEPTRYLQVRGEVVGVTTEGGREHIEQLSQKYTGGPYRNYSGQPQERVIVTIRPEKVSGTAMRSWG